MAANPRPWLVSDEKSDVLIVSMDATTEREKPVAYLTGTNNVNANAEFIVRAVNNHDALVAALERVRVFLRNGIALGYIRMPDTAVNDPASEVPGIVESALRAAGASR